MKAISGSRTGRAFLATLSGTRPFELRFAREAGAVQGELVSRVEDNVQAWLGNAEPRSDGPVMDVLEEFVNSIAHGVESEWRDFDDVLSAAARALTMVDVQLSSRPELRWWASTMDRSQQVGFTGSSVSGQPTIAKSEEALRAGSVWWVTPTGALTSSRREAPGTGPVAARLLDDYWVPGPDDRLVPVAVDEDARVYEVADADDWAQLVRDHPRPSPELLTYNWGRDASQVVLPDWGSVATAWDGVHVSVAAYLNAAYRPIPLGDGTTTVLAGWHPDSTAWLTGAVRPQ